MRKKGSYRKNKLFCLLAAAALRFVQSYLNDIANKTDKEITAERAQMRKRKELASEEKVSLVEEYLAGRLRMREAAREARLGHSTMENWISRYRSEGASGLRENGNQAKCQYSWGVKRRVVGEYLSGQGSSMSIAEKYQLCSENRVLDWVKAYHDRTSRQETGGSVMRKDHTVEKRLRAVPACLDGGKVFEQLPWPTLKNYIT